jgi:hypothetical protein
MSLARSLAQPIAKAAASPLTGGGASGGSLRLISTRGSLGGNLQTTGKQHMTAINVKLCAAVDKIRVVYAGSRGSVLASDITVKAAVWKSGSLVGALSFGGNATVAVAAAATVISDELAVTCAMGDVLEIRTYATVASGTDHWGCQYLNGLFGDGREVGTTVTDKTTSGTVTAAGSGVSADYGFTPAGVLGVSSRPAVIVMGDSISIGTGDTWQVGYLGIAYERNLIPYFRTGAGGSTGSAGVDLITTDAQVRAMCAYIQAGSWQYGVNGLASGNASATLVSQAVSWAAELRTLVPGVRTSISTVLPVTLSDNSAVQNNGSWNSTKEAQRVIYNNSIRTTLPTGFNYLWEAAGDASGVSGLFRGPEATKDGGLYRADFGNQNGFAAINDGLHPGRPLIIAAAAALDLTAFLGVPTLWGPEIAYATIPTSGLYAESVMIPSRYPVAETPGSVTGITIGGTSVVLMSKIDDRTIRLYCSDRIGTGSKSIVVGATNIAGSSGTAMHQNTIVTTNNSTWAGSNDPGTVLASDAFTRADTSYNATPNNTTAGTNWTDRDGNGAKIDTNRLSLQGTDAKVTYWNAATYTDVACEVEFDPADSTASSTDPFNFKLGARMNLGSGTGNGIFATINRKGSLTALTRLELNHTSAGTAFSALNASNISIPNGTRYKLALRVSGSGASKTITATITNASTGATLYSVTASSSLTTYPDAAGYCGLVSAPVATNDVPTALNATALVDSFAIRSLTDITAPVYASSTLSSSGRYIDVAITELGLPLLPASGATGFSVSSGTISESVVYGADNVRVVLASAQSLPLTFSYSQAAGNVTDQTGNELTAFTNQTVS